MSISSEYLLTVAVERSLGICACSIVSTTVVDIYSAFIDVLNDINRAYNDDDNEWPGKRGIGAGVGLQFAS